MFCQHLHTLTPFLPCCAALLTVQAPHADPWRLMISALHAAPDGMAEAMLAQLGNLPAGLPDPLYTVLLARTAGGEGGSCGEPACVGGAAAGSAACPIPLLVD